MDYVNNSIHSIRNLRSWAHFITQFPPSVIEHKRRNNSQFLNLLEQLWGTENLLCHLSSPTLKTYRVLLRELDDVIGRAIALVKEVYLCSELPREHYSGEHYLEVFLELRWWTWVVICVVADGFIRTTFGREYFVIPKGILDPASSRLPSFLQKLHLWCSGSDGYARHLPSYGIEAFLRKAEGLSTLSVWLKTTSGRLLNESDVDTEYIIEGKALVPVLGAYKPPRVRERKVDLTQVILGVSHSALVIKCEDSGKEYALKRVNGLDLKQPILAHLFHPHVVRLLDFWRENGFLFLAMELMEGDLAELIARRLKESKMPFTMDVAVDFMLQIAKTMLYLHDLGLTHPHLQSSDVLFKEAKDKSRLGKNESHYLLKLGDFRFYAKNDFKSVAQQNVYQFGLICVEVLSNEPLRWTFEERILGMSQKPKDCFSALRDGSQSSIPELLTECIRKCLGGTTLGFSEVVVMLLLAQLQVLTKAAKEPSAGVSDGAHLPLAKQQDVWSKPGYSSRSPIIPEASLADVPKFPEVAEGARSVHYKVGKDLDDVKRASASGLIPKFSSSHISEVKDTLHSKMGEDLKLTPVKDDFGASQIPVYLSSTDFEEGGYMESLTAGLDLCDKQIQESVNLLSCVNIFKFLSKYLVETLSSSVEVKFTRYRRILGLLHNRHRQKAQISTSLRNSISFCFESLVGLARQFQFVVNLLMKCGSPDWYKSALELADVVPAKHIYRWSRFSLLIRNCEFSLDLVELAFHALEKLLTEDVYTVKDATFKWSEERCRMVLHIGSTLDRKYKVLKEPLLETCRNLEDMDLTALTEKLQKLIEFEKTEKRFLQGSSDVLKIANHLCEKLKASTGMHHHPVTFTDMDPSSLKYLKFLDNGSSGMVAVHEWYGMKVAVKSVRGMGVVSKNKIMSKNKSIGRTGFEQEVGILAMVQHPNVVRFIGCGFAPTRKSQIGLLVMELMDHDLRAVIDARLKVLPEGSSPFSFIVALDLMFQIAQAMRYLREHNILHCDLKAKNILVNICKPLGTSSLVSSDSANTNLLKPVSVVLPHTHENYVAKLADFGLAKYQTKTSLLNISMAGTAGWRAPEVFYVRNMEVAAQEYDWPADVYSYAMTCYEILTGKIPFEDNPNHMLHDKIMAGVRPSLESLADIPEVTGDFKELLNNCWATDPRNRPSFEYIEKKLWECKVLAILSGFERQIMETSRALGGGSTLSSEPILEFKHKIFLSHSGAQTDFVEILCDALEQRGLFPFFDKRPSSLPRGEKFPELIFSAARQCQLAVVVISEEYFMSKWPMLELALIVQAMRSNNTIKILPLYYGLSRSEFTDKKRQERWFIKWKEWAKIDSRIDIEEWMDGLRVLHSINGMEYNRASQASIVAFRDEIVFNISRLVAPNIKWDDSHVQGKSYICQAIYKMFQKVRSSHPHGIDVVGLYGIGGIGKTTICNTLCNELFSEFEGRVCRLEYGALPFKQNLQQLVINLTSTDVEVAQALDESQCMDVLRGSLHKKKTFLAIDNVQDNFESSTQVRRLLQAPFHEGSKLIVTARSVGTLERLGINRGDCLEMPELEHEHATNIFLDYAAHGKQFALDEEKHAIDLCVKRCYFHKGYKQGGHYHPLALQVLGIQMSNLGTKPLKWVKYLDDRDENFNLMESEQHPVSDILRSSFNSLPPSDQTLFVDVIVFAPTIYLSHMTEPGDMKEWLCLVHQEVSEDEIKHKLMHLTRKGLLEDVDLTSGRISIHDLYREFAKLEVKAELDDTSDWARRRWVYVENRYPKELVEMTPRGRCWENLRRVGIYQPGTHSPPSNLIESLEGIEWSYFPNLEVLNLAGLPLLRGVLNLKELRRLRSLQLYSVTNLDRLEGLEGLRNLTYFRWCHANGSFWNVKNEDVHTHVGEFPASLKVLQIEVGVLLGPDVLARCQNLCKVVLYDVRASNLDFSNCSSLKTVKLYQIRNLHTLLGLTAGWASRLESLVVQRCKDLVVIPGLDHLIGLQRLVVEHCKLKEVPDLQNLTTLQVLRLGGEQFPKLKARLQVPGGPCIPKQLRELICRSLKPTKVPNISGFEKLEVLDLSGKWTCMEDVGELPALRCLDLSDCTVSSRLPDLSKSMNLEVLNLEHCEIKLHEEDVRMLASLPLLQPVPVGGRGQNCVRLDLARRKVLRYPSSAGEAPSSWLAWKEHEWEESDFGILPIRFGRGI